MKRNIIMFIFQYSYQNQTRNQASDALSMYRNLKPFLENCTLPNGTKRDLVCLKGTIPVTYRSSVYNIPISIWILNNYPYSAPICWVNPTKNMVIKVSQVVDNSGRVYLPYLANWSSETSDLLGVIQVMIIAFSQTPPLYSTGGSTSSSSSKCCFSRFSFSPSNCFKLFSLTDSNTSNVNRNVTNPPYPTNFGGMYPQPSTQSNYYPPIPISATPSNDGNANPPYPAYPSQPSPYYPMPMPNASQTQNATTGPTNSETISAEHIRLSLESAAEDLLKNRLKELCSQYEAEINVIRTTGNQTWALTVSLIEFWFWRKRFKEWQSETDQHYESNWKQPGTIEQL